MGSIGGWFGYGIGTCRIDGGMDGISIGVWEGEEMLEGISSEAVLVYEILHWTL